MARSVTESVPAAGPRYPEIATPPKSTVPGDSEGSVGQKLRTEELLDIDSILNTDGEIDNTPETALMEASGEDTSTLMMIESPTVYVPDEGLMESDAAKLVAGSTSNNKRAEYNNERIGLLQYIVFYRMDCRWWGHHGRGWSHVLMRKISRPLIH